MRAWLVVLLCIAASTSVTGNAVPRTLALAPAAGSTITFAGGGNAGQLAPTRTIAVTASGNTGVPTLSGCAVNGANAAAFTVAPVSLSGFDAQPQQNLVVDCVYGPASVTALVSCTESDADSFNVARSWTLVCPAGAVVGFPALTANPPSGSTITVVGHLLDTVGTGLIDFTATFLLGSSATIACTSTGAVRLGLVPAAPDAMSVTQTVTDNAGLRDVRIGVVLTSAAQRPAGTISCSTAIRGGPATILTYTVNAPAGLVEVPVDARWSLVALLLLLGAAAALAAPRGRS